VSKLTFTWLNLLNNPDEVGRIGQVTVVELETDVFLVGILIEMVNSVRVEQGRTALNSVYFISFGKQKLSKIGTVLSGNTGNEGFFHGNKEVNKKWLQKSEISPEIEALGQSRFKTPTFV
jgi:hypothetical protein